MITVNSTPQKFTPAFNPIVFSLNSDNYSQPGFKYVADVLDGDGGLLATLKFQPPVIGTDAVTIDVSKILNDLVISNYCIIDSIASGIVSTSGGAVSDYSVQFGEEYSNVIHANLASYSGYVFNGALDQLRIPFFNSSSFINTKFLSRFQRQSVRKRDSAILSVIQSDTTAITGFDLKIYSITGMQLLSTTVSNPYTSLSDYSHRVLHLHVGFDYLYSVLSFSGTIYNQAAYYTIAPTGGAVFRIDLNSTCERFPGVRLLFLNDLGGFDGFNFQLDNKYSQSTERKTTLRQPSNRATGYSTANRRFDVTVRNYYTRTTQNMKLISDYLSDIESQQLVDLLSSSLVYMEADAAQWDGTGMVLVPVTLKTLDYELKKTRTDKVFNLELDIELSADNYRQVI